MQMFVGYAGQVPAGSDVDAPSAAVADAPTAAHAVAAGSPVAVCGAPVDSTLPDPWPPSAGAACPRCLESVRGYTS